MRFSERLRQEREKRNLGQKELSLLCRFEQSVINKIEREDRKNLTLLTVQTIAIGLSKSGPTISSSQLIQNTEYDSKRAPHLSAGDSTQVRVRSIYR